MKRHDRINNWDLVDLGCLYMTGSYLFEKPRTILYKLAKSKIIWERRTAILSSCYLIRKGDIDDTFKIAEMLVNDKEDLIHKATGWMLRFAGDKNRKSYWSFWINMQQQCPTLCYDTPLKNLTRSNGIII
jgi:3-methyladenine DNA glycosylase AlkD